jgi:hypothetical protein
MKILKIVEKELKKNYWNIKEENVRFVDTRNVLVH